MGVASHRPRAEDTRPLENAEKRIAPPAVSLRRRGDLGPRRERRMGLGPHSALQPACQTRILSPSPPRESNSPQESGGRAHVEPDAVWRPIG